MARHRNPTRSLVLAISLVTVLLLPMQVRAEAEAPTVDPASDPEVARILQAKGITQRWNYVPAGKRERYGHAETLVEAPVDKVQKTALDFAHYKELHRKFSSARVVGKEGNNVDVYMRIPVKLGPVKVDQWAVMRFAPARTSGNQRIVEGRGVQGNMRDGHIVITVRPVDEKHSLLKVDILLVPSMPAPQPMVDEELRDAAGELADGLKDRAQGWVGPVTGL